MRAAARWPDLPFSSAGGSRRLCGERGPRSQQSCDGCLWRLAPGFTLASIKSVHPVSSSIPSVLPFLYPSSDHLDPAHQFLPHVESPLTDR